MSESTNSCRGVLRAAVAAQTGSLMERGMWGEIHLWDDALLQPHSTNPRERDVVALRMGSSGSGGGGCVCVCVCASGKIEERGEKMQRRLCHVSMEINKLCRMHGTAYHTCIQVHTHREQREARGLHGAILLLCYLLRYCLCIWFKNDDIRQDGKWFHCGFFFRIVHFKPSKHILSIKSLLIPLAVLDRMNIQ